MIADRYQLIYVIVFVAGIGVLIPWNFYITSVDYFMYKFRNTSRFNGTEAFAYNDDNHKTSLQQNFELYQTIASQISANLFNLLNFALRLKYSPIFRFKMGIIGVVFPLIATFLFTFINTDSYQTNFFFINLIIIIIINGFNSISQASVFGIGSCLPQRYMISLMQGNAISGIIASLAEIISLALSSQPYISAHIYFGIALLTILFFAVTFLMLPRNKFCRQFMDEKGNPLIQANAHPPPPHPRSPPIDNAGCDVNSDGDDDDAIQRRKVVRGNANDADDAEDVEGRTTTTTTMPGERSLDEEFDPPDDENDDYNNEDDAAKLYPWQRNSNINNNNEEMADDDYVVRNNRNPASKYTRKHTHKQANKQANKHSNGEGSAASLMRSFRNTLPLSISNTLVFFVTLSIFPTILVDIQPIQKSLHPNSDAVKHNAWLSKYFVPVGTFLVFNVFDYLGRWSTSFVKWPRQSQPRLLLVFSVLRFLFFPLFMLCNFQPRHRMPMLLSSDAWPLLLNAALALSNGYVSTLCMMYAPSHGLPGHEEFVGTVMVMTLNLGIGLGTIFAAAVKAII